MQAKPLQENFHQNPVQCKVGNSVCVLSSQRKGQANKVEIIIPNPVVFKSDLQLPPRIQRKTNAVDKTVSMSVMATHSFDFSPYLLAR